MLGSTIALISPAAVAKRSTPRFCRQAAPGKPVSGGARRGLGSRLIHPPPAEYAK